MQFFIPASTRKRTRVLDDDFNVGDDNLGDADAMVGEKASPMERQLALSHQHQHSHTSATSAPFLSLASASTTPTTNRPAKDDPSHKQLNSGEKIVDEPERPPPMNLSASFLNSTGVSVEHRYKGPAGQEKTSGVEGREEEEDTSIGKVGGQVIDQKSAAPPFTRVGFPSASSIIGAFPTPGPPLSPFPSVPYYALGNTLDIYIGTRDGSTIPHGNNHCPPTTTSSNLSNWSSSSASAVDVGRIHVELQRTAKHHGTVWCLSSSSLLTDAFLSSSTTSASRRRGGNTREPYRSSSLSYDQLSDAMASALQGMAHVRTDAAEAQHSGGQPSVDTKNVTEPSPPVLPHAVFLRVIGHTQWKDIVAMLGVERGRLILYIASSSRPTQQHITTVAVDAGVPAEDMVWVAGAILVTEPPRATSKWTAASTSAHSVMTVWSVLSHMLAHSTSSLDRSIHAVSLHERQILKSVSPSMVLEEDRFISSVDVEQQLRIGGSGGDFARSEADVTIISSLALPHAQQYTPQLRLVETQPITLGHPQTDGSFLSSSSLSLEGADVVTSLSQKEASSQKKIVAGYRYVWRLTGAVKIVHPLFLTHVIHSLVHRCGLRSFDIRLADAASLGAISLNKRGLAPESGGFTFVRGALQGFSSSAPRGSSSASSWQSCSRLSTHAWLSEVEREQLGMVVQERDEKICLEGEFLVSRICFKDVMLSEVKTVESDMKHNNSTNNYNDNVNPRRTDEIGSIASDLFDTHLWPSSFQLWKSVTLIIDEPDEADVVF